MPAIIPGVHNEWMESWVVFGPSSRTYPWDIFTRRDMAHCWVFWTRYIPYPGPLSTRLTMKAEHTPGGMYQDVTLSPPEAVLEAVMADEPTDVLQLRALVQRNRLRYFGLLTCVTVVKAVLNLDAPWCLTPAQLHRRLLSMGAHSTNEARQS